MALKNFCVSVASSQLSYLQKIEDAVVLHVQVRTVSPQKAEPQRLKRSENSQKKKKKKTLGTCIKTVRKKETYIFK